MSSPARVPLPAQIGGERRLTPDGRRTSIDRYGWHLLAAAQRGEHVADRIEVLRDRPVLNDRVRLLDLVEVVGAVQKNRTRVDSRIDAQQRHADAVEIAPRQRPEAAVRVAVLGADAWMQDERADAREA